MSLEKETLGAAIKQVRLARGLTQVQLAALAGLSKGGNSIALIEQGKRFVSVDTLNELADALDVPPACLALLGSQKIKTNKAATEFMQRLQQVISAVIRAQEQLPGEEKAERKKRRMVPAKRRLKRSGVGSRAVGK
jgi:transcriptional regulator with XRE-family HTH domain